MQGPVIVVHASFAYVFQGGAGGDGVKSNGAGGWSYYNPSGGMVAVLDERQLAAVGGGFGGGRTPPAVPATWKTVGAGRVVIVPAVASDSAAVTYCRRNCTDLGGAVCVALDAAGRRWGCVCPASGLLLDYASARCSEGKDPHPSLGLHRYNGNVEVKSMWDKEVSQFRFMPETLILLKLSR